jgi:hypothetical protein
VRWASYDLAEYRSHDCSNATKYQCSLQSLPPAIVLAQSGHSITEKSANNAADDATCLPTASDIHAAFYAPNLLGRDQDATYERRFRSIEPNSSFSETGRVAADSNVPVALLGDAELVSNLLGSGRRRVDEKDRRDHKRSRSVKA